MLRLLLSLGLSALSYGQQTERIALNQNVNLEFVSLPVTPPISMGRMPVTMRQFRIFVDETGYQTDAENPAGNGPERIGGHGWNGMRRRFEGWFPQYTWRRSGWPLTDDHPVSNVSWNDAVAFCKWLSGKSGREFRLPTQQEWDRAAHAGSATMFFTGDDPASLEGYANVGDRALSRELNEEPDKFSFDDGYAFTSPVASFKPNAWGLYDMIGNVFNWCAGPPDAKVCGCSYNDDPQMCRDARGSAKPYSRYAYFGFRVVMVPHN